MFVLYPSSPEPLTNCVIASSSFALQCVDNLDVAFGIGATMFAFDFAGSGRSDGEYVTLGEFEKDDVAAVRATVSVTSYP